ncbi:MAG: cation:proton antiporter subunit C [Methanotrichaceae archaeon]|nr:cation:proton antiporter subunit C [Methanotrichaceae archaeon]
MIEWITLHIVEKYNFWIAMIIVIIGLTAVVVKENLLKKLIGLSIFQTAFFLWVVSLGDVGRGDILRTWGLRTGAHPILWKEAAEKGYIYMNPLPHVLMLTGIVVSAATTAVALAIVIRIYQKYGTIEEGELIEKELQFEREGVN